MSNVNPVQTTTYYLNAANNPITFGTRTDINVSSGTGIGVYGSNAQSWSVTNKGAISGHLYGVDLTAGGSVTNKAGATISGGHYGFYKNPDGYYQLYNFGGGVRIAGGLGSVTNAGTINSDGKYGIYLGAGGSVSNGAGATISGHYVFGPGIGIAGGAGTVTNAGDISGFLFGVELQAGGSVTNQAGGAISGLFAGMELTGGGSVTNKAGATISAIVGVQATGAAATVTNAGAISGLGGRSACVGLYAGGSVTNKVGATISGGFGGVYVNGGAGTVTNAGDIRGGSDFGVGVAFYAGGSATNLGTGTMSAYDVGVFFLTGAGTLTNAGTINGHDLGVFALNNAVTVTNAGDISGEAGVVAQGSAATVTNSGAIAGTKVGSTFFFAPVTLGDGVFMNAGGAVTNKAGGTITGAGDGVYIAGGGSVTNKGAISGLRDFGFGVHLAAGGSVANESGATISGWYGVQTSYYDAGTVTNAGRISGLELGVGVSAGGSVINEAGATISASGTPDPVSFSLGVRLLTGGTVTNKAGATISAYSHPDAIILSDAIGVYGAGVTLENDGKIVSNGNGVSLVGGGVVNNGKGGTISGDDVTSPIGYGGVRIVGGAGAVTNSGAISGKVGVYMNGYNTGAAETVTNAGTISGTIDSIEFGGAGANTLTLKTGSTLTGDAIGSTESGATNALVLQGHGTANNNFDDFDTLSVQANGNWTLGGDSTFGATTVSSGSLIVAGDVSGGPTTLGDQAGDVAKLVIASTGTWDILDDSSIGLGGCTPSFVSNSGLFEKTGGTGTSAIAPAVVNKGTIEVTVGTLDLQGPVAGKGTAAVSGAATLEFDSTVAATQTIDFLGGPSAVDLIDPNGFLAKIAGFASSDTVQLSGDWVFSSFAENAAGTLATLTLANGASHHAFNFVGDYTATDFKVASGATTTISHA